MATPTVFTWKSVTDASMNVVTRSISFYQAEDRVEIIEVEGRDGASVTSLGKRPYTMLVDIELLPSANIDNVIAWLQGVGTFVRADDSLKYVNARIISQINYAKVQSTKQATVEFFVYDPYRYVLSESPQTITSFPGNILNVGTAIAKPLLKITGSGTVVFVLNGTSIQYIFPSGETYVYIDCDSMDAYYDSTSALRNRSMTGNFPTLAANSNNGLAIISGTITEVVVTKRTRYL